MEQYTRVWASFSCPFLSSLAISSRIAFLLLVFVWKSECASTVNFSSNHLLKYKIRRYLCNLVDGGNNRRWIVYNKHKRYYHVETLNSSLIEEEELGSFLKSLNIVRVSIYIDTYMIMLKEQWWWDLKALQKRKTMIYLLFQTLKFINPSEIRSSKAFVEKAIQIRALSSSEKKKERFQMILFVAFLFLFSILVSCKWWMF